YIFLVVALFTSCNEENNRSDAYGNFEATTTLVSAEANGRLLFLNIEEGEVVTGGQLVALVDTVQLNLQRQLLNAQMGTLPKKLQNSLSEIEVLERQKDNLQREKERVERLLVKKAATTKQLDDLNGEIEVVNQRIQSINVQTRIANRSILAEKEPLLAQRAIINDQIRRSYVHNPFEGTILTKLAEPSEMVAMGAPLYRIADLDTITLKFYASATQLQGLKLGQPVEVLVDEGVEDYRKLSGMISKIADQAEFTPKTIQTKEDRVNLVYAIEAKVPNADGRLKIGMPAEVNFNSSLGN
ncbi:MAG: HlyD family efflux transporter periplasmic adaptor subunit, partial [Bacteroidota bacterium]